MKKIILIAALAMTCAAANADNSNDTCYVYMGTKASNNSSNPCKGAATRVCAIVKKESGKTAGTTKVKIVKDGEGKVLEMAKSTDGIIWTPIDTDADGNVLGSGDTNVKMKGSDETGDGNGDGD